MPEIGVGLERAGPIDGEHLELIGTARVFGAERPARAGMARRAEHP